MCYFLVQLWEDKEGKKKMNKNNAKALSTLRQKIRKYNRDFETEIASYKEVRFLDVVKMPLKGYVMHSVLPQFKSTYNV